MKRVALTLLSCILIGAMLTMVVAWSCALFVDYKQPTTAYLRPSRLPGEVHPPILLVQKAFGSECVTAVLDDTFLTFFEIPWQPLGPSDFDWCEFLASEEYYDVGLAEARGWPVRCVHHEQ